ncbi:MAG: hypothetical protein WBO44_08135, partial [Saprospiraceae bacterium]
IIDTPCRDTFFHKFGEWTYKLSFGRFPTFLNIMYSDHLFGHKQILSKIDIKNLCELNELTLLEIKTFKELSFPFEFYLNKMQIPNFIIPFIKYILTIFYTYIPNRNKMLIKILNISKTSQ